MSIKVERVKKWPKVLKNDHGIRPKGKPDECFYCGSKVGLLHGEKCVMVLKEFQAWVMAHDRQVAILTDYMPACWDKAALEYYLNQKACANRVFRSYKLEWLDDDVKQSARMLRRSEDKNICCCRLLTFKFDKVTDEGPFREVREDDPSCSV